MPVLLGLVGIWHRNVMGYPTRAVLPYDQRLLAAARLPAAARHGSRTASASPSTARRSTTATGPVVWGEPGTNGQHAFYQLIHQGTDVVPCEFMVAAVGHEPALDHQHEILLANCLAQSEALMRGRSLAEAEATVNGSRRWPRTRSSPATARRRRSIYTELDPRTLGRIIALYEHRVFVEGVIWGINTFDQWGVELGKELATALLPLVQSGRGFDGKDGSTAGLLEAITELRR